MMLKNDDMEQPRFIAPSWGMTCTGLGQMFWGYLVCVLTAAFLFLFQLADLGVFRLGVFREASWVVAGIMVVALFVAQVGKCLTLPANVFTSSYSKEDEFRTKVTRKEITLARDWAKGNKEQSN